MTKHIGLKTKSRTEFVNITSLVRGAVKESDIKNGICHIYVPHTTAGVTINEGADPSVVTDILATLNKQIPKDAKWLWGDVDVVISYLDQTL